MTFRKTLLAATMLAVPLGAQAQPVNGLYVAGGAGANWLGSVSNPTYLVEMGIYTPSNTNVQYNVGWVGVGSVGWGFGNGLRVEVEGSYRTNTVDSVELVNLAYRSPTGSSSTTAVMANVFYEFALGPVQPYLGAGIGYGWQRWSNVGASFEQGGSYVRQFSDTVGSFAWQGIAGIAVPIAAVPGLAITAEYRYFATQSVRMAGTQVGPGTGSPNMILRTPNDNQSVLLGVRYNFGRAPAAPPPVAAPAPATSFIVFFDFNRSDLTARAREIVAQAAAAARSQQVTRIEVAGHTDTVGSAQYNLGLSQRRANTVAAELVRLGVPRQAISTAGYGFSRPLVPTGPNVREPQNRRVEIVFR